MQRFLKAAVLSVCIFFLILIVSGCSSNKKKNVYTLGQIEEGFYVKFNEEFYPLIEDSHKAEKNSSPTVSSDIADDSISVVWICEGKDRIPVYGKDCELVYLSEESIPDVIPLYHLTDYGVTLGMRLARTYDGNVLGFSSNTDSRFCDGSDAESVFDSIDKYENVKIVSVGGSNATNEILTEVYTIKNLTENADYDVVYYVGTKCKTDAVTADTHVFSATKSGIKSLSNVSYTKNGYIILNLPDNLSEGYYYIDDGGVFYYAPGKSGGFLATSESK